MCLTTLLTVLAGFAGVSLPFARFFPWRKRARPNEP